MRKLSFFILISFIFIGFISAQTITVTSPHTGDTWYKGSTYTITWTKTGTMADFVKIKMRNSTSTAVVLDIISHIPNNGSYSWTIPASVAPGNYVIRVRTMDNAEYGDSDVFAIADPPTSATITVMNPHTGTKWCKGDTYTIQWTKAGTMGNFVKIKLRNSTSTTTILDIINSTLNDGNFSWPIPASVAPGNYRIRVITTDSQVYGDSEIFKIQNCLTSITSKLNINTKITKESVTIVPRPYLKLQNSMDGFLPGKCNVYKFSVDIVNKGGATATNIPYRLEVDGPQGSTSDNLVMNGFLYCPTILPNSTCNYSITHKLTTPGMYYYTFKIDPDNTRNLYKKTTEQISMGKPDLIVYIRKPESQRLALKRNVYFFVKNQGKACSSSSVLKTYMKKKGDKNHNIPQLRPGDIYKIKRGEKWFTLGTKTIRARADHTNVIDEMYENNNTDEKSVKIVGITTFDVSGRRPPAGFFENSIIINE